MVIGLNHSNAMYNLGLYYNKIEKDYLEFYKLLINHQNKNDLIKNKLEELETIKLVQYYINKMLVFKKLNNYKNCLLCLDCNVLNLIYDCGHEICFQYYNPSNVCGLCKLIKIY